jgi:hypothetical protein
MKTTKADKAFSKFIRLRASDSNGFGACISCGRVGEVKYMDCGHYIKRQFKAHRFSEMNCQLQCKSCNNFLQGNDVKFRASLVENYGEDAIIFLELTKNKHTKISKFEEEIIAKEYTRKYKEILKSHGLNDW